MRIERALSVMFPSGQHVFSLLPVLLHCNHPQLPGYISPNVACGIDLFEISEHHKELLSLYFPDIVFSHELLAPEHQHADILGLYGMGSTSSMGQSTTSDLDIWICVRSDMVDYDRKLLEQKGMLVSEWAVSLGVEVNFFVVDEHRFKDPNFEQVTMENCGTTQHYLLLDEFYRTNVRLAGRELLWFLIPVEQERHYEQYVSQLYASGELDKDHYIDFGPIEEIPATEYVGASLWQLYKSIDSPYKSVLKAIMLEVYSWEYPNPGLISVDMKRILQSDEYEEGECLDAYFLMLKKVTDYLVSIKDEKRLEIVRFCLYLKTHEKLTMCSPLPPTPWRRDVLVNLVTEWGWSYEHMQNLDRRRLWKVDTVRTFHKQLFDAIMQSYRALIRFSRNNDIESAISPEDISILARKLYAAYESFPGKIELLSKQLSPDMHEDYLSFIAVPEGTVNASGWYVYACPLDATLLEMKSIEYNQHLITLLGWCYFNGLLVKETQLDLVHRFGDMTREKLQQLVLDIRTTFVISPPKATMKALSNPSEINDLAVFINLEQDVTQSYQDLNLDGEKDVVFNYGKKHINLVGSVDVLYLNSWGEVRSFHFAGNTALLDTLQVVLGRMHHDAKLPRQVKVFAYSEAYQDVLQAQVQKLLYDCIEMRLSPIEVGQHRHFKSLRLGKESYGLFFERRGVSIQKLDNTLEFYSNLSQSKLKYSCESQASNNNVNERKLSQLIDTYASKGLVQFFFYPNEPGFTLFILDDENQLEVYHQCCKRKEDVIQEINHYYTSLQNKSLIATKFNLPQFYDIQNNQYGELSILPYHREK